MDAKLRRQLLGRFGYNEFLQGQKESIQGTIDGKDVLFVTKTDGGKTFALVGPAVKREGVAIIVTPLIALMADQIRRLKKVKSLPYDWLSSSRSQNDNDVVFLKLANNKLKVLFVTPERLRTDKFLNALSNVKISHIGVDEAHCIVTWGEDFRPDYLNIGAFRKKVGNVPIIAVTATATNEIKQVIKANLGMTDCLEVKGDTRRPNIKLSNKLFSAPSERDAWLIEKLKERKPNSRTIVYFRRKIDLEAMAQKLRENDIRCSTYHASMTKEARSQVQIDFQESKIEILFATVAFGMGIDLSGIETVIHVNTPSAIEFLWHEVGRAGRGNLPAEAILATTYFDHRVMRDLIYNEARDLSWLKDKFISLWGLVSKAEKSKAIPKLSKSRFVIGKKKKQSKKLSIYPRALSFLQGKGLIAIDKTSIHFLINGEQHDEIEKRIGKAYLAKEKEASLSRLAYVWKYLTCKTSLEDFIEEYFCKSKTLAQKTSERILSRIPNEEMILAKVVADMSLKCCTYTSVSAITSSSVNWLNESREFLDYAERIKSFVIKGLTGREKRILSKIAVERGYLTRVKCANVSVFSLTLKGEKLLSKFKLKVLEPKSLGNYIIVLGQERFRNDLKEWLTFEIAQLNTNKIIIPHFGRATKEQQRRIRKFAGLGGRPIYRHNLSWLLLNRTSFFTSAIVVWSSSSSPWYAKFRSLCELCGIDLDEAQKELLTVESDNNSSHRF